VTVTEPFHADVFGGCKIFVRGPAPVSCALPCGPRSPGTSGRGCGTPEIPNLINVPTETVTSTEIGIQSAKRRQRSR
jgi:hypothetical protein